jgi:imidazolonepropionase-like amidohydrolase
VVKLIYGRDTLDKETVVAAVAASREVGAKTVVHIGSWQHAKDAIEAGATAVTHLYDEEVIPDSLVQEWADRHTVSIPTMAVQCDMENFTRHPQLLSSPLLSEIESHTSLDSFRHHSRFCREAKFTVKWQHDDIDNDMESFRKLAAKHVTILAGSDVNNMGTFQGFSLHREIKIMQDAGYSAWEALASATTKAASFLGRPSGINAGDTAELVVLDADPLKDIANTQKIFAVIHHGILVDRQQLWRR